MPGMGQMIYERGRLDGEQRGEQNAIVQSIRNLMTTMKWTAEQAIDVNYTRSTYYPERII